MGRRPDVTWTAGDRTRLRDTVVGDDPDETAQLADALRSWAAADPDVTLAEPTSPGEPLTVTSCHPPSPPER